MRQWVMGLGLVVACNEASPAGSSQSDGEGFATLGMADDSTGGSTGANGRAVDSGSTSAGRGAGGEPPGARFDVGAGADSEGGLAEEDRPCDTTIEVTLRDFMRSHGDMEYRRRADPGIVEPVLGSDGLPVYAGGTRGSTRGPETFNQWYRDVPGVNITFTRTLELVEDHRGFLTFDSTAYFPLDGEGFGNEGNPHNYHFTLEFHTSFTYKGGEVFTFRGDDDVFAFINGRLAIDLGGIHLPQTGTIDMDALASELELEIGETYPLDFFFAERHTTESNFRVETSIECFKRPPPAG